MTDKTKRVFSKIHKTALILSLVWLAIFAAYQLTIQIHDYDVIKKAIACRSDLLYRQYFDKYGENMHDQPEEKTLIKRAMIMGDKSYQLMEANLCSLDRVELKGTDWDYDASDAWYAHTRLDDALFTKVRVHILGYLLFFMFVPVFLIAFKKWLIWLVK